MMDDYSKKIIAKLFRKTGMPQDVEYRMSKLKKNYEETVNYVHPLFSISLKKGSQKSEVYTKHEAYTKAPPKKNSSTAPNHFLLICFFFEKKSDCCFLFFVSIESEKS